VILFDLQKQGVHILFGQRRLSEEFQHVTTKIRRKFHYSQENV